MSELERFAEFFRMLGYRLEGFQELIVEECFSPRRETVILIPRANGKSTLLAAIALWSLLRGKGWQIVVGAASREQASVLFDIARSMAQHPEVAPLVEVTRREIRIEDGWLRVIAADGPKQHGLIVDLAIVDELHAHRRNDLYTALRTAMQKRPGARMITISTAGARVETPLGRLRDRALRLPKIRRDGAFTRAEGEHLAMLAWELPEGGDPDDLEAARACNPASWLTVEGLAEQKEAVHPLAWQRYHLNVWTGGESPWILPDEWGANAGKPEIHDGDRVVVGVDASVIHDTTAVCVVRKVGEVFHAIWRVWVPSEGREVPLADVESYVRELVGHYAVETIVYDRAYFSQAAQNLEAEGAPVMEWAYGRNAAAAATLHEIVVHGRLRHGGADLPRRHALAAEVKQREFGEVISKQASREPIDCLMALAYAVSVAAASKPPARSIYETEDLATA
jgi:phage terminase large subunit-like protein